MDRLAMTVPASSEASKRKALVSRFHAFPFGLLVAITATALVKIKSQQGLPVHWAFDGKPDQYWPRDFVLAAAPIVALGLVVVFALIGRFAPVEQVEPGRRVWEGLLTALLAVLCAVQFSFVLIGVGSDIDLLRITAYLTALALVAWGGLLAPSTKGTYGAMRLPWSLPTASAWVFAHRASGALVVLSGIGLGVVATLWPSPTDLLAGMAGAIAAAILGSALLSLLRARG